MCDTHELIKNIAVDIIFVTTTWSLVNNPYMALNYYSNFKHLRNIFPMCSIFFGVSVSTIIILKYW